MEHSKAPNTPLSSSDHAGRDPIEAIYALNIGDFVAESFISDELLSKITDRLGDNPGKLKAQLEELIHIYSIDKTLGVLGLEAQSGFLIYDSIASTLAQMFQVSACHLFQTATKDTGEQSLNLTGTSLALDKKQRWEIIIPAKSDNLLSDLQQGYETRIFPDLSKIPNWKPNEKLAQTQTQTQSLMATPLREGGKSMGLLIFETDQPSVFSDEMADLADIAAKVFVTGMRLQQLVAEAQERIGQPDHALSKLLNMRAQITESIADLGIHQQEFVEALSKAVDARQNFTKGHSKKVGELAKAIAEALELNEKTVDLTYLAGLLGSVGKVHIPQEIIRKKESLSPADWDHLRDHPNVGVSLLVKINFLSEVIPFLHSQNERWDGSGGPEKLKGRSIPLGSRILAVANAYYAMTQERPYRGEALSPKAALKTLQTEAGTKWDPLVVEALCKISVEDCS
ncbi:HD domain-containing phosphohydrolase [Vampirovibrio sp.]|uniref:HD domain-containing phosphohydrolase n=1 Tax=Vampirovibrio sp. TaxID=2717857 RepID=UPI0035941E78